MGLSRIAAYPRKGTITTVEWAKNLGILIAAYPRKGTITAPEVVQILLQELQLIPARGR